MAQPGRLGSGVGAAYWVLDRSWRERSRAGAGGPAGHTVLWIGRRSEGGDLPFEERGKRPVSSDAGLAVDGGDTTEVVGTVHQPGWVAGEFAPIQMGDSLVQAE